MTDRKPGETYPFYVALGHEIRGARRAAGLHQQEVAELIGFGHGATVSYWESGKHGMRVQEFVALCRVLNVKPAAVLDRAMDRLSGL